MSMGRRSRRLLAFLVPVVVLVAFIAVAQGLDGGEARVARARLVREGWSLTIPGSIADRLAEQGAPPTPRPAG
ncbi:MAG: hypothetical protein JWM72_3443 [Actinomycetia bacterium]|jgi:hypothetical protein|nr:hypothetical protein [Actinomycetes bacterium]MDQ1461029.1 hypothetical protein [Actinomycetota bacterium]